MMEFEILDGNNKYPYLLTLYGPGGVGKTGLASYAPEPFYIATERGTQSFCRSGFKMRSFKSIPKDSSEFFEMLKFFIKNIDRISAKTLVIDNLTELQPMFYADVIRKNPIISRKDPANPKRKIDIEVKAISDYDFGHGFEKAMDYWHKLFAAIEIVRDRGVNVICVAHSHLKTREDDLGDTFKAVDMNLQSWGDYKVPELFYQKCDAVYYMTSQASTFKVRNKFGAEKTMARGAVSDIVVYTRGTTKFFAKVRASNAEDIPDYYEYSASDVDDVSNQIFNDLEK